MNNIIYKKGKHVETFDDMQFSFLENERTIEQAFEELGFFSEEKGQLLIFEGLDKNKYFFFNCLDPLPEFLWNSFKFVDIFFESRKEYLEEKILSYLQYVYINNIDNIKNITTTGTIKDKQQLLENISNIEFIKTKLNKKDRILLKEIYFLFHKNFFGWADMAYVYTFKEEGGKLRPVRFEEGFLNPIFAEETIDKVEVLLKLQKRPIINLLFEKIENETLFSKKKLFTKRHLQEFYNEHIGEVTNEMIRVAKENNGNTITAPAPVAE